MSNTTDSTAAGSGNAALDYLTKIGTTVALNFTPLAWFEQMSKLFCYICNSEDPKVQAASGLLNFAIIAFVVAIAAKVALAFWTFYKYYIQQQFISAGANSFESKYKGTWVVITGATDGIGLGFAKEFAARKAKLVLVSRNQAKLDDVKSKLEQLGAEKVDTIQCDFSEISHGKNIENDSTISRLRSQLDLDNRKVGILINNVGIVDKFNFYHNHSIDSLVSTIDVNLVSAVLMSWLVAPNMSKRKTGAIVNISSIVTAIPTNYCGMYRPSKVALDSLSEQLAFEYPELAIINLRPGATKTNLYDLNVTDDYVMNKFVLTVEKYVSSAINIIQAASTSPGLTQTTGHMSFEVTDWIANVVRFLGIGRMVARWMKLEPQSDAGSTRPPTTSNKDVAETNIDIPLQE